MPVKRITPAGLMPLLPERPAGAHKGTFGHLYAIAGSRGFTGAAKMVGLAAGRSGAGLVTVGVPDQLDGVVSSGLIETMTMQLPATPQWTLAYSALEPALEFAQGKEAVALGPGLSQHPETVRFVLEFVARCPAPMVIDADALNALSTNTEVIAQIAQPFVLTPHPGEMARLCGMTTDEVQAEREEIACRFAEEHGCTVVLKGRRTLIANPKGEAFVVEEGNSGMATGGTGDVLTGLIGGLMAQGMDGFRAAAVGAYLHATAGDLAAKAKTGRGMVAMDLLDQLPNAWHALEGTTAS